MRSELIEEIVELGMKVLVDIQNKTFMTRKYKKVGGRRSRNVST